jgi:uncharacterized circularly permuted ATP-grasp superfamily protein
VLPQRQIGFWQWRPRNLERDSTVVVLTPGIFNRAYFEHSVLADQMAVELMEEQDRVVADGALKMKTTPWRGAAGRG